MGWVLQLDWKALLREVDEGFLTWRKPAALVFGGVLTFLTLFSSLI